MANSIQINMDTKGENTNSIRARRIVANIVLIFITFLCLIWFYILLVYATKSHGQITGGDSGLKVLIPRGSFIANWKSLMGSTQPVWYGLMNSLIISAACAVLSTYFSVMTAYSIHVYRFRGRKAIATFILGVMMIPTQVTALGFLDLIDVFKMMDTPWPLIIPSIAAPATFFYMKQYLESALPLEIVEAARIDGASEFRTFNTIVMAIVKPAIAVQAIFVFVSSWNNYFTPALVLSSEKKKTLPILIAALRSADFLKFDMGQVYMMITFSILPVIIVYMCLSRYIVGGIAAGSVKG